MPSFFDLAHLKNIRKRFFGFGHLLFDGNGIIITKQYPYQPSTLDLLTEKSALFLLGYFRELFANRGKSKLSKKKRYELATLGETVDSRCLPAGYSAGVIPLPNACDHCHKKLDDG